MWTQDIKDAVREEFDIYRTKKIGDKIYTKDERCRELLAEKVVDLLAESELSYREAKLVLYIAIGMIKDCSIMLRRG